jgi:hypothetical protein
MTIQRHRGMTEQAADVAIGTACGCCGCRPSALSAPALPTPPSVSR